MIYYDYYEPVVYVDPVAAVYYDTAYYEPVVYVDPVATVYYDTLYYTPSLLGAVYHNGACLSLPAEYSKLYTFGYADVYPAWYIYDQVPYYSELTQDAGAKLVDRLYKVYMGSSCVAESYYYSDVASYTSLGSLCWMVTYDLYSPYYYV